MTSPEPHPDPTGRSPGGDARDLTDGPLAAFTHDVDVTWFDTRTRRLIPLGLAALIAVVAANAGVGPAFAVGIAIAVGLGVAIALGERERWRAQDVLRWYLADRTARWIRDTGGPGPRGDAAASEVWLGAHQPGTVPQIYRALVAAHTGDARVLERERAALPSATAEDRAWRIWAVEADRWNRTGVADTSELEPLVASLPATRDRAMFESWLGAVEASRRHAVRDAGWIEPLASRRSPERSTRLRPLDRIRIWLSRLAAVIVFATSAAVLSSIGLTLAARDELPRPEYADTTLGGRGDFPLDDADVTERVTAHLHALERAVAGATRTRGPLDDAAFEVAIDGSLPTLIWSTGGIAFASPADAAGRRVWEVEVPLGGHGDTAAAAILTLDGAAGPRYLYAIDPAVVRSLREAAGLAAGGP